MRANNQDIQDLMHSNALFRRFMNESAEAIWCIELEQPMAIDRPVSEQIHHIYQYARFTAANDAYARLAGYPDGEAMVGLRLDEVMPPKISANLDTLQRLIGDGYSIDNLESVEITQTGDTYHLLNNVRGIVDGRYFLGAWGTSRDITAQIRMEKELRHQLHEIRQLQQQIQAECTYLQEEIKSDHNFENIVGNSNALKYVLHRIGDVAPTDAPVLIMGETGTGKELIARAIHHASARSQRNLVKINCAALPASLIESELFGHAIGAFTGADARRMGRFQLADGTTLFLDEISEIPVDLQAKLLRVLQDGEFEPVGSSKTLRADVRIIAASNRNLDEEVNNGRFRPDLLYRINVFPLTIPPLRARKEDIPLLVNWFLEKYNRKLGKNVTSVPAALIRHLQAYEWPGNIRELENVIARAFIITNDSVLKLADRLLNPAHGEQNGDSHRTLAEVERQHILKILELTHWKIEGVDGSAKRLGLSPSTLRDRMKKLGIHRPRAN